MTDVKVAILHEGLEKAIGGNLWVQIVPNKMGATWEFAIEICETKIDPSEVDDFMQEVSTVADVVEALNDGIPLVVDDTPEAVSDREWDFLANAVARLIKKGHYKAIHALLDF